MERVGRVIDVLAVPGDGVPVERFWNYRPLPQLDALLVRPHIVEVIQACCRATDEPTLLLLDHREHPRQRIWLQQHVVVDIVDIVGLAPGKEERTLLRHAATRQVAVRLDPMATPAQRRNERANLDALEIDLVVRRLIGDHDVEVDKGLSKKTRQDDRQAGFPATRRNQHVDEGQGRIHLQ